MLKCGVRLDRNQRGPGVTDRQPGGDISVGGNNHLIALRHVQRAQNQMQRIQPIGHADAMTRADVFRKLPFQRGKLLSEHIPARIHDALVSGVKLRLEFKVGGLEFEEGNLHAGVRSGFEDIQS